MTIISGGQTGVDRAALSLALAAGIPCEGWCPNGRLAEDGVIPPEYPLQETASSDYAERTERNVIDSDGTLIFARESQLSGGTLFTLDCARRHQRPVLVVRDSDAVENVASQVAQFVADHSIKRLNVAGPRESQAAGLDHFVKAVLQRWLNTLPS